MQVLSKTIQRRTGEHKMTEVVGLCDTILYSTYLFTYTQPNETIHDLECYKLCVCVCVCMFSSPTKGAVYLPQ